MSLVAVGLLWLAGCSGDPEPLVGLKSDASSPAPSGKSAVHLLQPRAVHHATALGDGLVLVTGGCTEPGCGGFDAARASEIFDPSAASFLPGPTMLEPRASGTATLLPDGRVLLTGGYPGEGMSPVSSAEVFDPATGRFSATAPMTTERANHSATLLDDGRVLLCGGVDGHGEALQTTELFDPRTATFSTGPDLSSARAAHSAVALGNRVVLVGGIVYGPALATTDVFRRGAWTPGPELRTPRVKHAAGRVTPGPALSEGQYKLDGAVTALADGRVVIAGGQRINVYDPADDSIAVLRTPVLSRRSFVTATAVGPRTVLVAGGYDDNIVPTTAATLVTLPR